MLLNVTRENLSGSFHPHSKSFSGLSSSEREGQRVQPAGKMERIVSGLFVHLDKAVSIGRAGGGWVGAAEAPLGEENPSKEPLLVKTCDGKAAFGAIDPATTTGHLDSWKNESLTAAEQERHDDEAEARGDGFYSLHAVLGQGSFGRIHLTSWQREEAQPAVFSIETPNDRDDARENPTLSRNFRREGVWEASLSAAVPGGGVSGTLARGSERSRQQGRLATMRGEMPRNLQASLHRKTSSSSSSRKLEARRCCDQGRVSGGGGEGLNREWERLGSNEPRLRALKSVCKRKVTEKGLVRHVETELAVLQQCSHPFIVSLSPGGHFQTSRHLHLVLNYCPGGDLSSLLGRQGKLAEPQVRVCAAQLALALRHLHDKHIAYRDLKPENVCIDARGHAILLDFSLARVGLDLAPGGKAFTFCGSAAYAAPEMLAQEGHDTRVDLWSLGCVVFEALVGAHPFRRPRGERSDRQALFDRIRCGRPEYPSYLSASALSFLQGLLAVSPNERLGFGSPPSRPERLVKRQSECHTAQNAATAGSLAESPSLTPPSSQPPISTEIKNIAVGIGDQGAKAATKIPNADEGTGLKCGEVCGGGGDVDDASTCKGSSEDGPEELILHGQCSVGSSAKDKEDCVNAAKGGQGVTTQPGVFAAGNGGAVAVSSTGPSLLLEHVFFGGLPGWGGPGTGGAWDDMELKRCPVVVPELRDALDVQHFDHRFTSQEVELALQGHPHKGGRTPSFENFEWRPESCIEYAQAECRRKRTPGFFESVASAIWC